MDKKGSTFGVWLEVILFSMLFVVALGVIGSNMNAINHDTKDISYGLATESTLDDLKSVQSSMSSSLTEGTASISTLGIFTITTIPKIIMTTLNLSLRFVMGGWIKDLVGLMNLGEYTNIILTIFQILYFFVILFILVKIITRVVT